MFVLSIATLHYITLQMDIYLSPNWLALQTGSAYQTQLEACYILLKGFDLG